MSKGKQETIFVPGLNQDIPVDQIANINPDIDIRDATHFLSIHHTDDINYNQETKKFTRSLLSTAHASIEFIARGEVEGHFGKHPVHGSPIDIAKIKDDSERYNAGQKYDQKYGTNTVYTKILPVTKEHYSSSFDHAKQIKDSPGIYNLANNNCNNFVNDVIQATGIPDINISKLYTGEELREYGKPVTANVLANHGACDTSFTVMESIHTNVADKYKVPQDRILAHHVDPSNPDVRFYTIYPEGVCPSRVVGDDTVSLKNPFLTQPTFQQENIGIASKLYPKDYPITFGNQGLSNHNPLVNGTTLDLSVPKPSFQVRDSIRGKSSFGFKPLGFTSSGSGVNLPLFEVGVNHLPYQSDVKFPVYQTVYFGGGRDRFNGQSEFERTVEFVNRGLGLLKAQAQRLKDNAITKSDHITADIFTEQAWAEDAEWHRELAIKNNDHGEHGIEFRGKQLQGYYRNIARLLEELETEAQRIKDSAITPSEHLKADIVMNKFLLTMHEEMRVIAVKKNDRGEQGVEFRSKKITESYEEIHRLLEGIRNEAQRIRDNATNNSDHLKADIAMNEAWRTDSEWHRWIAVKNNDHGDYGIEFRNKQLADHDSITLSKLEALRSEAQRIRDNATNHSDHLKADIAMNEAWRTDSEWYRMIAVKNNDHGEYGIEFRNKQLAEHDSITLSKLEALRSEAQRIRDNAISQSDHLKADIAMNEAWRTDSEWYRMMAVKNNDHGEYGIEFRNKQLADHDSITLSKLEELSKIVIMSVHHIEYDNPVLNHPELIKGMADKFGSGIINKLIDFGMEFMNNQENKELLESICNQTDNVDTMSLLMGFEVHDDITYH